MIPVHTYSQIPALTNIIHSLYIPLHLVMSQTPPPWLTD